MFIEDIIKKSTDALNKGYQYILKNKLHSIWNSNGYGWHEQLQHAKTSGVYASCEGLMLLKNDTKLMQEEWDTLQDQVFRNNLLMIFDESKDIEHDNDYIKKLIQRNKTVLSTYKLSKFIMCSSIIDMTNDEKKTVTAIVNKLISIYKNEVMLFLHSEDSEEASVMATALAVIALASIKYTQIENYLAGLKEQLEKSYDPDYTNSVLALWAFSYCDNKTIEKHYVLIKEKLDLIIRSNSIKRNRIYTEKFVMQSVGIRDSYSINRELCFYIAILNYIDKGWLSTDYLRFGLEMICTAINIINNTGIYSENGDRNKVLFWENYYMLSAIDVLRRIMIERMGREEQYMIIHPIYFHDVDLILHSGHVAVIMPFSTDWSDRIFNIFCEALPNYTVWRSKEDIHSDAIMQTVWENINKAEFVIADCSGKNANVFYELGIAHTLGKQVFMCAQCREDFPFDINYLRSFVYDLTEAGIDHLKKCLSDFAKNTVSHKEEK